MEPIIKVRYKEAFFLCLGILANVVYGALPKCDKTPHDQGTDKIAGDNGFAIHVSGSPRMYRPNQLYNIQLSVSTIEVINFQLI